MPKKIKAFAESNAANMPAMLLLFQQDAKLKRAKFDAKFYEGAKALPTPAQEMCVGCQQAMERIRLGAFATPCPVCGCFWVSKAASLEFSPSTAYKLKSQEEFDAKFYEDVRAFRECAEKAGCDMAAFDMEVACRKARIDEFRANAQHFYRQHPGTPSGR